MSEASRPKIESPIRLVKRVDGAQGAAVFASLAVLEAREQRENVHGHGREAYEWARCVPLSKALARAIAYGCDLARQ